MRYKAGDPVKLEPQVNNMVIKRQMKIEEQSECQEISLLSLYGGRN